MTGLSISPKGNVQVIEHIVSLKNIAAMPGFLDLTRAEMLDLITYERNLVVIGQVTNREKGGKLSWSDYMDDRGSHFPGINRQLAQDLMQREQTLRQEIQQKINNYRRSRN